MLPALIQWAFRIRLLLLVLVMLTFNGPSGGQISSGRDLLQDVLFVIGTVWAEKKYIAHFEFLGLKTNCDIVEGPNINYLIYLIR